MFFIINVMAVDTGSGFEIYQAHRGVTARKAGDDQ